MNTIRVPGRVTLFQPWVGVYICPCPLYGGRTNMRSKRSYIKNFLAGALASSFFLSMGCGGGPRYGASHKKNKSCDCPHWNKVTTKSNAAWSKMEQQGPQHGDRN
jgi:hypothetical protein